MQGRGKISDPEKIDEYWQPWVLGQMLTDGTRKCLMVLREPPEPQDIYDVVSSHAEQDDDVANYFVVPLKDAVLLGYEGVPSEYAAFLPNYKPGDWYRLWKARMEADLAAAKKPLPVKKKGTVKS